GYSSVIVDINEVGSNSFIRVKIDKELKDSKGVLIGKPVIYLYPQTETSIEIKLQVKGELATTYPKYNNGWQVVASPNGELTDAAGKSYSYLFWDGYQNINANILNPKKGFVVSKDSAITFLENILPQLNLSPKEYNDFIVYWLPVLELYEYSLISFYV